MKRTDFPGKKPEKQSPAAWDSTPDPILPQDIEAQLRKTLAPEDSPVAPAEHIRTLLLEQLEARRRNSRFLRVLHCRIPVYQVAAGFALLTLVLFYSSSGFFPGGLPDKTSRIAGSFADSTGLDSLSSNSRTILEDSLLARFFNTTP